MQERSSPKDIAAGEDAASLTISPEKVCFVIIKAKEFDAKDEVTEPDPGQIPLTTRMPRSWKTTKTIPCSKS